MKHHPIILSISLLSLLLFSSCTIISQATQTPIPVSSPTANETIPSEGPFLLLQADYHTYEVIDFSLGTVTPYPLPESEEKYDLASNLSPSGTQMILHVSIEDLQIMDLLTGNIRKTFAFEPAANSSQFQLDQAVSAALEAVPDLGYSEEEMLAAVESAYTESLTNVQWYQDDEHLLTVSAGSASGTHLFLDDLQSGERVQLENVPGLVQSAWASPDGKSILLKKGFIFESGIWQDDCYYLLTVSSREAYLISLPEDSDNPSLSWLTSLTIGVIHQTAITGGAHYSVIDIPSLETRKVIEGDFTLIRQYSDSLLTLQQHKEDYTTSLSMIDFDGTTLHSTTIEKLCTLKTVIDQKIILNCETEGLILDADFQGDTFTESVFLLTPAPDGNASILVTRSGAVFLLSSTLEREQTLVLEGDPLEILWLPDSSGFLYRTLGALYYYDLSAGESTLLLTSDLFGDYTNLNAVWVNFQ